MKKLPKIYQNTITKKINNNKTTCYLKNITNDNSDRENIVAMNNISVNSFIDDIFNSTGYAFNIPIIIKTNNNIYETSLIAKRNGYVLTFDNDKIYIEDIISIKRKNP